MFVFLRIRYFIRYVLIGLAITITIYFIAIPIRLIAAQWRSPHPQAILTLGGSAEREIAAAELARQHPELEVWVSTGENLENSIEIFKSAGIDFARLHLDWQAVDTVTNFTTTVDQLQQKHIQHIYLITSDFHMRRARAIAFLVLGSRGIAYTPVTIASTSPSESAAKALRDVGRSLLWLATGKTGASVGTLLKPSENR